MKCLRCRGYMIGETDYSGAFATCLYCGYVRYDTMLDEEQAQAETVPPKGKRGKRRIRASMSHGIRL